MCADGRLVVSGLLQFSLRVTLLGSSGENNNARNLDSDSSLRFSVEC